MTDWTTIANQALNSLGSRPISTIDEQSISATRIKGVYLNLRDEVLGAYPWKCALKRMFVPADAKGPDFGAAYYYTLPTEPWCLKPHKIGDDDGRFWNDRSQRWSVEGRKIITDIPPPIKLIYIQRLEDPNLFSGILASAMSRRIAAEIAFALTNSRDKETAAYQQYNDFLSQARSSDAQQGTTGDTFESEILEARY
jgi:hypothetical protein